MESYSSRLESLKQLTVWSKWLLTLEAPSVPQASIRQELLADVAQLKNRSIATAARSGKTAMDSSDSRIFTSALEKTEAL